MSYIDSIDFSDLAGKTLDDLRVGVNEDDNDALYILASGRWYIMSHWQDCCEMVTLEDAPDVAPSTRGATIVEAAESVVTGGDFESGGDTSTATFYQLRTSREDIAITWRGTSNGYYSENVGVYLWDGEGEPAGRSLFGGGL